MRDLLIAGLALSLQSLELSRSGFTSALCVVSRPNIIICFLKENEKMKRLRVWFTYFLNCFSGLKHLSECVNAASTPDELDELVCGGRE